MHLLYNSDSFVVLRFDVPTDGPDTAEALRGGYEIVDKHARTEIFLDGALAERFRLGVDALVEDGQSTAEVFDDFIEGFTGMARQPLLVH